MALYILHGSEQFLIKKEISKIISQNPNASIEKDLSLDLKTLVEMASMPSLFSPQRIYIVDGPDLSDDISFFVNFLERGIPSGVTIIIKNPESFDKRNKFYKIAEKYGKIIEFKKLADWDEETAARFVVEAFTEEKKKCSLDTALQIVQSLGTDLSLLNSEAIKIATFLGEEETVSFEKVKVVMTQSKEDVFALFNALTDKNAKNSLMILAKLIKNGGENPIALLSFISSQFRSLLKIRILHDKGQNINEISTSLGLSSFYAKKLYMGCKKFTVEKLCQSLELMYDVDIKLKSGFDPKVELPLLIANILAS